MGSALEIGIKFRKVVVISIRGCYRSVCNHPFLVCFLGFLLLLYRYFPFLFSVLVSASPVLVCTAVLLGTLLSFGQPNLPEFEKEEKVNHDISSFQTGFSVGDTVVVDRDQSYFVKGYSEYRSDVEESGVEEASLAGERDNRGEEDCGLLSDVPLDDENPEVVQPEKPLREEVEREFHSFELGEKSGEVNEENLRSEGVSSDEEAIEKQYVLVEKVNDYILDHDIENEKTPGGPVDFSPRSSWKHVENSDDDDDDSVESGSDQAESSSPDASMADIMPMLDELHPLLDLDAPRPAHISRDGSDAASEKSQKSNDDSVESDEEDAENHDEVEEDGVDERDDEEETEGGKEDESKSAVKWTEDDQRNLMDLGSLELERNQRLENLIARRRARRLMAEKNLIDFDSADIPINVAPITTRRNPFDFPDEFYANMGLPPIPGSAPSILQPRRNPFDIPYDPSEEKPDLKGDSFQQEFTMFTHKDKDTFFRRHESFSMGSSVLGLSKHERHDINWKPVFITERMASEGTSYGSFQRQSSEVSDSKMSSVPDTESVSSIDHDERKFSEQDLSQEAELMSNIDHASDGAEHGSQSSGENDSVEMIEMEESDVHPDEVEIVLGGVENPTEMEFYPETEVVGIHEQFNARETYLRREPSDEDNSSRSSRSSLSEVIDNIPDETTDKTYILKHEDDEVSGEVEESRISTQGSVEESIFQQVSGEVEGIQHVEPVYDSSPPASGKLQSFASVSADLAMEFSERSLPPVSVEMADDVADEESELHDERPEGNNSGREETQGASSQLHMEVKNELRSEKSEDINQHNVPGDESYAVDTNLVDQNGSIVSEGLSSDIELVEGVTNSGSVLKQDLTDHISADSEIILQQNVDSPSEKSILPGDETVEEGAVLNGLSRYHSANMSEFVQDADEILDSVVSDVHHRSTSHSSLPEASVVHSNLPSEKNEHEEIISPDKEDINQIEQDKIALSSSVEQGNPDIYQDLDRNTVSFTSDSQQEVDVDSSSNSENHQSDSDKLVVEPSSSDHDESQNSDIVRVDSAQDVVTSDDGAGELHDAIDKAPLSISSVTSETSDTPEFNPQEVDLVVDRHQETESVYEEVEHLDHSAGDYMSHVTEENKEFDDIKEIDEEFLSELDIVGDFSVRDASVSLHTDIVDEKTVDAQGSSLSNDVKIAEVEQDIPVLEARSLEDINLAFKQLQEGIDVKEVLLPSTVKDQLVSEESKDHPEVNSDLQVIEARSAEDTNIAFNQSTEGNHGELPKPLDLNGESDKIEENDVGSTKVIENIEAATSADELNRVPSDKPENAPLSKSGDEGKISM
ncbi:hypothetical protein TanjilG_29987 [Lupinus angustifolius]|uniref:Uncharacterized protein n=1 Tax=Lupinus angustifolius TaxID=3871 RepID=A0A394DMC8_LUPAN|nr:PREDICTED: uncharacterized protein LOC109339461 isoform X1 [Lupinus angustifolius]OIW21167.1 hypothetical protein TanjilG_29987 [Lupinus angustifolius]